MNAFPRSDANRPVRHPAVVMSLVSMVVSLLPVAPMGLRAANGSLWTEASARVLLADTRARQVGDIVTIVVDENNESAKQNNTKTAKKTGVSATISSFLFGPAKDGFLTRGGKYPAMDMKSDKSFEGGGTINNSERITARIAVWVNEVLPNGHMTLEGRRMTLVGGEQQEAVLRGVIRQEDIQPNNTVMSFNVADASIKFVSKGTVSDIQRSLPAPDPLLGNPSSKASDRTAGESQEKIREMTQKFEAVFVRHLLNEAQKPVIGGGAIAAASSRGIYQDMIVERMADQISESGTFGVARSLELQFRHSSQVTASTPHAAPEGGKNLP